MQRLSDEARADIARAWAEGVESVAAIAARHRLFPARIYVHARQQGWPPRPVAKGKPPAKGGRKRAGERPSAGAGAKSAPPADRHLSELRSDERAEEPREAMVRRLLKAIETKLEQLEKRMSSGKAVTAADSERQTRELAQITRAYENVLELSLGPDRAADRASAPAAASTADAERWRHEIAERLERLARRRDARG